MAKREGQGCEKILGAEPYKKSKTEENSNLEMNLKNLSQYYYNIDGESALLENTKPRVSTHQSKFDVIIDVLRGINFTQAMIFYNDKARGEEMVNDLK